MNEKATGFQDSNKYAIGLTNCDEGDIYINIVAGDDDFTPTHWCYIH